MDLADVSFSKNVAANFRRGARGVAGSRFGGEQIQEGWLIGI